MTVASNIVSPQPSTARTFRTRFIKIFNRLQPTPETILLLLAALIGGVTGMGVVTFHYLIYFIHSLTLDHLMGFISRWGAWTLACVPTLGGVVISLMRLSIRDFGPGITSLIAAAQGLRELTPLRPVSKMLAAAISLGTGASLGPEGPSVETGANFGMLVGQVLKVSQERQCLLLGAGAAAGLAAGFNAPIAGVFFALEVVLGTSFATSAVSVVLLAAVVSALIAQICLGNQPAFDLPAYEVRSLLELPLYLGLGLLASVISLAYTQAIQLATGCFTGEVRGWGWLKAWIPRALHPMLGGLFVGVLALYWPQVLGVGYETIESMLQDVQFSLGLLVGLLVLKLLATAVSLASGLVGGMFAPAMFLGASLGLVYAKVLAIALPGAAQVMAAPPAYAMVGMAAVLASSAKAPLTAILLLFELTRDYRIVLPLMASVGLSVWLMERFKPKASPATLPDTSSGLQVPQETLKQVPVAAAMQSSSVLKFLGSMSILEAGFTLINARTHSALVVDEADRLIGIVTLQDINRAIARTERSLLEPQFLTQAVQAICTTDLLTAYPDESIAEAQERMARRGLRQLPVVERHNPQQAVGLLEKSGINLAGDIAITQEALMKYLAVDARRNDEIQLATR